MGGVLFFHGRESSPSGNKARWLRARYGAFTPGYDTNSLATALPTARAALAEHRPEVVVGSSFGGAVACQLVAEGLWTGPTILIAPASRLLGGPSRLPEGARAVIFHGEHDSVVPLAHSQEMAGGGVELRVVAGGDHPLNCLLEDGAMARALAELGVLSHEG
ncbi:MAG: hypothetical protein FJ090_15550 [Deltaproteobacteria bacterium]|nr:hypothetical protein [Deltaproteobacteria bacterium]MBM4392535.1 hypothetical protein [Deltaproteobacteria bacterium]